MARTVAGLGAGCRLSDHIGIGVLSGSIPRARIEAVLAATGRGSVRQRELPAHVVVYYVVALALYMQASYREVLRCLLEGLDWLGEKGLPPHAAGKSGISQARARLGAEPLERLYEELAQPVASADSRGAWYRQWRLVSLDGSTLDVADTAANAAAWGRPSTGGGRAGAYPQVRFVALLENGTHVLFGARMGGYASSELTLAQTVVQRLQPGQLCLADRYFFSYKLWRQAAGRGGALLWRVRKNLRLERHQRCADGSYLSAVYDSTGDPLRQNPTPVRVIEYRLEGAAGAEPLYRLVTNILDPLAAPAAELAALYHQRWEMETAFDELKTHLRGPRMVLRSKTPELVRQEFYGLLLAHFALRQLMHQAALRAGEDPDRLSFLHSVRVVRRKLPRWAALPPSP